MTYWWLEHHGASTTAILIALGLSALLWVAIYVARRRR